jgi:hypothetical protein
VLVEAQRLLVVKQQEQAVVVLAVQVHQQPMQLLMVALVELEFLIQSQAQQSITQVAVAELVLVVLLAVALVALAVVVRVVVLNILMEPQRQVRQAQQTLVVVVVAEALAPTMVL